MVAQDQKAAIAQVCDQTLALARVERDALVVVVAHEVERGQRLLGHRQQATLLGGYRDAIAGVQVHDRMRIGTAHVNRTVDGEARLVHVITLTGELVAFDVDLDQRRRGDFLEQHAVGIDQELVGSARHAARDVRAEHVGPAHHCSEAVRSGEIDARLPLAVVHSAHRLELGPAHRAQPRDIGSSGCCFHDIPRNECCDCSKSLWARRREEEAICYTPLRVQAVIRCDAEAVAIQSADVRKRVIDVDFRSFQMKQRKIPAVFMRGGTSNALVLRQSDLPADRAQWDEIFLAAIGSPDPYGRQLDGMGGGISSLSKVCVVGPPTRSDADIDYTFAQVQVKEAKVDYSGNCGNMSSAMGPFAADAGLVKVAGKQALVRIHNTNTKKIIHAHFALDDGLAAVDGDLAIPGVAGTGAPVRLEFREPGGATTGKLLPTGNVVDTLDVPGVGRIRASLIDAANATCFLDAAELGLTGTEMPDTLDASAELLDKLDRIRVAASVAMGIAKDA